MIDGISALLVLLISVTGTQPGFSQSAWLASGTSTGVGGGGEGVICRSGGCTHLIDLPLWQPAFDEPVSREPTAAASGNTETEFEFHVYDEPAAQFLLLRLQFWSVACPRFVQTVQGMLRRSRWSFSLLQLHRRVRSEVSLALPRDSRLVGIAETMSHRPTTVFIRRDQWLRLGSTSRAGLLLHEAIRRAQILRAIELNEAELTGVVAAIMTQPQSAELCDELERRIGPSPFEDEGEPVKTSFISGLPGLARRD